jgi:hypothetical protein
VDFAAREGVMVDRAAGAPRPVSQTGIGGLGPRGRGLFDRLLGSLRGVAAPRAEAISIAVASGKGGTGKSFVATSLAVLLHRRAHRTAIVDCDFGLACDHLLLGVKPSFTLQQLVAGKVTLDQTICQTGCGPRLLPGASGVRKMAALADKELSVFAREVGALAQREDALVLDDVARAHVGIQLGFLGEIADDGRVSQHRLGQLPLVVTEPELPVCHQLAAVADKLVDVCQPFGPRTVAAELSFEARCKQHRLIL